VESKKRIGGAVQAQRPAIETSQVIRGETT